MKNTYMFLLCCLGFTTMAQFNAIWYFGSYAGLNFNTSPPSLLTNGFINNPDNVSSICDGTGSLLFYTNGSTVWNKNNFIMNNGTGLIGNSTAGQCALIVPVPCSNGRYAIFSPTEFASPGNLHYSVVDITQNSGLGAVEVATKNTSLGTGWTEKLCAYFYVPGNYYWVLAHKWNSADFVAFKVDANGIATQSVVSTVGSVHNCGVYSGAHDAMGQLTISPDGLKVVNALTCQDFNELFDFNPVTGQVSNAINLMGDGGKAWGTVFSPDSRKLYTNSIFGSNIFQFDLSNSTAAAIQASRIQIGTSGTAGYSFGYMELAPDNKIYIPRPNGSFLAAITNPNGAGTACNFNLSAINLSPANSTWGLSRCAYNIQASSAPLTYAISSNTYCSGQTLTITMTNPGTYVWNNFVGSNVYTLVASAAQIITVTAGGGCQSLQIPVNPVITPPISYTVYPPTYCTGQTVTVALSGQGPYLWNTVLGGNTYTTLASGSSTINVSNPNGCSSVNIPIVPGSPILSYSVFPAVVCVGQNVTITVSGTGPFTWNNLPGGSQSVYTLNGPLTVNVYETESCRSAIINVVPKNCVGLEENAESRNLFFVFPNPCEDFLHVNYSGNESVRIYNLDGQLQTQCQPEELREKPAINTSDLKPGLYLISCGPDHRYFLKE